MAKKRGVEVYQEKVLKAVRKSAKDVFSLIGADTRAIARNSIKPAGEAGSKKGNVSKPGNPPFYHEETNKPARLKESIWYAWDEIDESVVIGAVKDVAGRTKGAQALERGGRVVKETKLGLPPRKGPPKKPKHGLQRPKGKYAPYRYFYSEKARKKALTSEGFLQWCKRKEEERKKAMANVKIIKEEITIQPRPYMAPALVAATERLPEEFKKTRKISTP